ncbi:hypothetical protein NMG60_11031383 [Bertholletia excelsa]
MTGVHRRVFLRWLAATVATAQSSPPLSAGQTGLAPPPPPPAPSDSGVYVYDGRTKISPTVAIILICIVCTIFILACSAVYIRQWIERRRAVQLGLDFVGGGIAARRRLPAHGLEPSEIEGLPVFVYSEVKSLKIGKGSLECAVCLNEFEDDETLRLLPGCSHVFHQSCIDSWLSSNTTCPVCRANLESESGETRFATLLGHDSEYSADVHDHYINVNHANDNLIDQNQSAEVINAVQTTTRNFPTLSPSGKNLPAGNLPRSHTTGHSLVPPGESFERFTLRLPEEVRNRLMNPVLNRARSCSVAFPRARSSRKGYRSRSGGSGRRKNFNFYERFDREGRSDRWGFITTPPFFSRAASARSSKAEKSATSPLRGGLVGMDVDSEGVNVRERSLERLRKERQVQADG